jgi:hypothetical protein
MIPRSSQIAVLALITLAGCATPPPPRSGSPGRGEQIDHIVIATADLDEGCRKFQEWAGIRPVLGGEHPGRGTRNALLSLGPGLYLEIFAPVPGAELGSQDSFLTGLEGLNPIMWAVSTPDAEATAERLRGIGFEVSEPVAGSREKPDGSVLDWVVFGIKGEEAPGLPFFIQWGTGSSHPSTTSPGGCHLQSLRITTPKVDTVYRLVKGLDLPVELVSGEPPAMEILLETPEGPVRLGG